MASSFLSCNIRPYCRAQSALSWTPIPNFVIFNHNDQTSFQPHDLILQRNNTNQRNFVIRASSVPPEAPPPLRQSFNPNVNEIIRAMVSIIMPYLSKTFGPLLIFKDKVDDTVEIVEGIVNVVEEVAEEVDKVAEGILDDLPEGKLKDFVHFVEDMAEETAHSADSIGDFIDEVQEGEQQLDSFVESVDDKLQGFVKNPNENERNNGIGSLFDGLLPSCKMFSYF